MTGLRIALVSEHASPLATLGGVDAGGQNVHVASLAAELAARGHQVDVYTRRDDPALDDEVAFGEGVTVRHVDAGPPEPIAKDHLLPYMRAFGCELVHAWRRARPDLVHAHFWMSGVASRLAARVLSLPWAQTFHALGVVKRRHQGSRDTSPPERLAIESSLVADADLIIATCSDEVFELARLGADPQRLRVVPCGVDVDHFTPDGPAEPRRPGVPRIVIVTRLVERKGVGNVITALAEVPDAELVVAGGPPRDRLRRDPEALRLRALAEDAGVADRVELRGAVARPDVPALLRSADVVACVPWYEPFGIVPLEAMACGVPVLASAVGGLIDTVVDGVTGLHVPPRSPERIAEALRALLADAELRDTLGRAGARRVRARFAWSRVAEDTLAAYASVLARQTVSAGEAAL